MNAADYKTRELIEKKVRAAKKSVEEYFERTKGDSHAGRKRRTLPAMQDMF